MGASLVRAATLSCSKTGQSATPFVRAGHSELDAVGGGGRACGDGAKAVANIVEPEEVIKCLTVRHLISHTTTMGYRNFHNSHDHNGLQNIPIADRDAHCEM